MSMIHNPHDKFVKASLKQKAIAMDFLKAHLPKSILSKVDLRTLEMTDKSYVTPALKELQSDIVYRCEINGETGYIPLLFLIEHQSSADEQMAFRLLEYTVHLMRDHLNAGHKHLPLVYPLCIYHGTPSPYPYSTDIYEMFTSPEFARQFMFKPFHLLDLTTRSVEVLEKDGLAGVMEILLKAHHAKKELRSILNYVVENGLLGVVIHQTPEAYLQHVLHYTVELNDYNEDFSSKQLIDLLTQALPDKREQIMTFREQLQQEGRQEGILLGMHEAKREDARKMLAEGVSRDIVKRVTGLSDIELDLL